MKQTDSTLPATQKSYALLKAYFSVQHNTQEIHFFQKLKLFWLYKFL